MSPPNISSKVSPVASNAVDTHEQREKAQKGAFQKTMTDQKSQKVGERDRDEKHVKAKKQGKIMDESGKVDKRNVQTGEQKVQSDSGKKKPFEMKKASDPSKSKSEEPRGKGGTEAGKKAPDSPQQPAQNAKAKPSAEQGKTEPSKSKAPDSKSTVVSSHSGDKKKSEELDFASSALAHVSKNIGGTNVAVNEAEAGKSSGASEVRAAKAAGASELSESSAAQAMALVAKAHGANKTTAQVPSNLGGGQMTLGLSSDGTLNIQMSQDNQKLQKFLEQRQSSLLSYLKEHDPKTRVQRFSFGSETKNR